MSLSVQTVLGAIAPEQMGFTLPHEHLFWDLGFYLDKSVDPNDPHDVRNAPLTTDQLGNLRYHMYEYRDNLVQTDVDTAAQELIWYRECGGGTICDNSAVGMGRFPEKIREASARSGVHVVLGTGAYCSYTLPAWMARMDKDEMAEFFVRELETGIGDTGIRCGFIGEIGINDAVCQLYYGKGIFGKLFYGILRLMLKISDWRGKPNLNALFNYNMPIRGYAKMTGGFVTMEMARALTEMANGHRIKGTAHLIRAAVRRD